MSRYRRRVKYGHRYWTLREVVWVKKRAQRLWEMFG